MKLIHLFFAALLPLAAPVHAETATAPQGTPLAAATAEQPAAPLEWVTGVVRKTDLEQRKLTLKHGPLTNLDMPAMTMVFKTAETVSFDGLVPGTSVKFTADDIDGALTVLALEVVQTTD